MVVEQRYNAPAHIATGDLGRGWGTKSWDWYWDAVGHVEQPLILLLHLLHHAQQERFTFPCRLLALQGSLFAGLRSLQLSTQQITLQTQQITLLVHGCQRLCFQGNALLERITGA